MTELRCHFSSAPRFRTPPCQLNGSCRPREGFKAQKILGVLSPSQHRGRGSFARVAHNPGGTRSRVPRAEASCSPAAPCAGLSRLGVPRAGSGAWWLPNTARLCRGFGWEAKGRPRGCASSQHEGLRFREKPRRAKGAQQLKTAPFDRQARVPGGWQEGGLDQPPAGT